MYLLQYSSIFDIDRGSLFQPLKYAYEAIMVNEFSTLNLECSNLVPRGPGYESVALENQVCAVVGAIPGKTRVNGLRYLSLSFKYEWPHLWRVSNHCVAAIPPHTRSDTLVLRTSVSLSPL